MTSITTLPQLKATYDNARRAMILAQMKQGRTMSEAAAVLGVSTSSIQNYCHKNGIKWRGRKRPKVAFCGSENPNAKLTERTCWRSARQANARQGWRETTAFQSRRLRRCGPGQRGAGCNETPIHPRPNSLSQRRAYHGKPARKHTRRGRELPRSVGKLAGRVDERPRNQATRQRKERMMQYEWEKKVDRAVFDFAEDALDETEFNVVAIAVENARTGEAALLVHPDCPTGGVLMADLWQDIQGDAVRLYVDAVDAISSQPKPERAN